MTGRVEFADDHALIVEDARVRLFRLPPSVPWEDATHRVPALEIIVLELTVNGRVATGFSYTVGVGGTAIRSLIQDYCIAELVGRDARYVIGAGHSFYHHLLRTGMGAITTLALSAIDVALWEIRAQASGRPMFLELGGHASSIPAYTSGIDLYMDPNELASTQRTLKQSGYRWFKIKVGHPDIGIDVARVAAAREAVGPDCKLVVDANQAWDLGEAIKRCRAFEPFAVGWMEEPLRTNDVGDHATLRSKTSVPIALGESLYTIDEFRRFLMADAVDIIQADIARVGGFSPWLKIANLAAAWNRPVAPHYFVELSVHALCAVDNGLVLENVRGGSLSELGLAHQPVKITGGIADPGQIAGHGVVFNFENNTQYEVPGVGYNFGNSRTRKV
jgi:L-alanine-DL-glutamate epimerase-like enolase superfamily enzyme